MDEKTGRALELIKPRPVALVLSALFYFALIMEGDVPFSVPLAIVYYLLLNSISKSEPWSIDPEEEVSDSFLSSFADNLVPLGPEGAFVEASKSSPSPPILPALARMREGVPLFEALLSIRTGSKADRALLATMSRSLSYSSEDASVRLKRYLRYRQERRRILNEYLGKMAVLSLRLKVLSSIAAASLAVIAFASPLLGWLSVGGPHHVEWIGDRGGILPAIAFLSVSIISPFLYSRTVPNVNGSKTAAACGVIYVVVFLSLVLIIGWRF